MPNLPELVPDLAGLLALEPAELGGLVLRVMNAKNDKKTHLGNFGSEVGKAYGNDARAFQALAEAWAWLEAQVLIVWPDSTNGSHGWRIPSRRGGRIQTADDFVSFRRASELPIESLHGRIAERVWPIYIRGDFDTAVFQAFKEVEVAVREASGLPRETIGVSLVREAFKRGGALADPDAPVAEQEALANLFAGAIGSYKNPNSHRHVGIIDAGEAREMISLASHLLRITDTRPRNAEEA